MAENKKTIIISVTAVILFIAAIVAVSFAYYTANISKTGEGNNSIDATTAKLSFSFSDGEEVQIENIIPGNTFSKTFSVGNVGSDVNYKIVINELINEFTSYEDITYTLKENDVILVENKVFPNDATKNELSETRTIKNGENKNYTLTITYHNTEEDQAPDMGKTISGKIFIEEL